MNNEGTVILTGRLENWQVQEHASVSEMIIWGDIYDDIHKRFPDGTWIHTSGILKCEVKEGDIINTRNSTYLLGKERVPLTEDEQKEADEAARKFHDMGGFF